VRDPLAKTLTSGHSGRVGAEPVVRLPAITDAHEIARTMNDGWRVGSRGLLPDAILNGLDDARGATPWARRAVRRRECGADSIDVPDRLGQTAPAHARR
jgi:hypothetical protein